MKLETLALKFAAKATCSYLNYGINSLEFVPNGTLIIKPLVKEGVKMIYFKIDF